MTGGTLFLLPRSYERTAGAVSATWLVDRHVLENLWHAGWRRVPGLSSEDAQIEATARPTRKAPPRRSLSAHRYRGSHEAIGRICPSSRRPGIAT